jgi:hypothetical protein
MSNLASGHHLGGSRPGARANDQGFGSSSPCGPAEPSSLNPAIASSSNPAANTGVRAGRAIEPRNHLQGAHALSSAEGNTDSGAMCEPLEDPAGSENHGMYESSVRENREIPWSSAGLITERAAQGTLRRHA